MALEGHLRSLILPPIESAYPVCDFLLVINSNLGPVLPQFRDIASFLLRRATPPPILPEFYGCPLGLLIADVVAPRSEDHKLLFV